MVTAGRARDGRQGVRRITTTHAGMIKAGQALWTSPQVHPQHVDNVVGNGQRQRVESTTPTTIAPNPINRFQLLSELITGTVVLVLAVT